MSLLLLSSSSLFAFVTTCLLSNTITLVTLISHVLFGIGILHSGCFMLYPYITLLSHLFIWFLYFFCYGCYKSLMGTCVRFHRENVSLIESLIYFFMRFFVVFCFFMYIGLDVKGLTWSDLTTCITSVESILSQSSVVTKNIGFFCVNLFLSDMIKRKHHKLNPHKRISLFEYIAENCEYAFVAIIAFQVPLMSFTTVSEKTGLQIYSVLVSGAGFALRFFDKIDMRTRIIIILFLFFQGSIITGFIIPVPDIGGKSPLGCMNLVWKKDSNFFTFVQNAYGCVDFSANIVSLVGAYVSNLTSVEKSYRYMENSSPSLSGNRILSTNVLGHVDPSAGQKFSEHAQVIEHDNKLIATLEKKNSVTFSVTDKSHLRKTMNIYRVKYNSLTRSSEREALQRKFNKKIKSFVNEARGKTSVTRISSRISKKGKGNKSTSNTAVVHNPTGSTVVSKKGKGNKSTSNTAVVHNPTGSTVVSKKGKGNKSTSNTAVVHNPTGSTVVSKKGKAKKSTSNADNGVVVVYDQPTGLVHGVEDLLENLSRESEGHFESDEIRGIHNSGIHFLNYFCDLWEDLHPNIKNAITGTITGIFYAAAKWYRQTISIAQYTWNGLIFPFSFTWDYGFSAGLEYFAKNVISAASRMKTFVPPPSLTGERLAAWLLKAQVNWQQRAMEAVVLVLKHRRTRQAGTAAVVGVFATVMYYISPCVWNWFLGDD